MAYDGAMYSACQRGHVETIISLLDAADLWRVSNHGANVLNYTAEGGDIECIHLVLANTSIDINSTDDDD
jgi:hypothetical protein